MNPSQRPRGRCCGAGALARLALLAAGLSIGAAASAAHCTEAPASGRGYYIVNKASGLQLDVAYGATTPEAAVIQWTAGTQKNQQWSFTATSGGAWVVRAVHSQQALDLYRWDPSENAPVKQYTYSGNLNQQWVVARSGDAYTIVSKSSGKLLTVADTTAGTALQQRSDQSSALQRWYFDPVDGQCSAAGSFGSFMGFDRVLVGGLLDFRDTRWGASTNVTDTLNKAPWDLRYTYVHSSKTAPQASCYEKCTTACKGWWGCENMSDDGQYNTEPGLKITYRNNENATYFSYNGQPHRLIEQWTWYQGQDLGLAQGALNKQWGVTSDARADYAGALRNQWLLKAYLDDYRFFLKKIGRERNIIQLEPDFWGALRVKSGDHPNDAHHVPATVKAASGGDCDTAQDEDSVAGLARCMIKMARRHAPNATVGLHLSCWDITATESAVDGLQACIRYYKSLGAEQGDFLVGDVTDRDAGWAILNYGWENGHYYAWDDAYFDKVLATIKTLTEAIGKPMILWQIPLGNENMPNTYGPFDAWGHRTAGKWKDDKVKHLFTKMDKVAAAHVVALQFGAGHNETTSTETDGGYLLWYASDYYNNKLKQGIGKLR